VLAAPVHHLRPLAHTPFKPCQFGKEARAAIELISAANHRTKDRLEFIGRFVKQPALALL